MKRFMYGALTLAGLFLTSMPAQASWSSCGYSGYQPWWNIFARRYKCMTPEEARLQKFWHDYYDALHHYYAALDHIDWVAYYKNHGYQINAGCGAGSCCGRINYAPVAVNPTIQWAIPSQSVQGQCAPGGYDPGMMGGQPMMGQAMMGQPQMMGGQPMMAQQPMMGQQQMMGQPQMMMPPPGAQTMRPQGPGY